MKWIQFKIY